MNSSVGNNGVGFADNFPPGSEGGGIYNGVGTVTITNSSVNNNHAGVPGPNFPTGTGGGAVNTSIKAGTNSFHFTAGEFIRNRIFDANTTQLNAAGQPRGKHNVNQISLTAGGAIRKNKDFLFGSIEIWRERVPFSVVADVPTMDLRNGQGFSAVPSNIFDPLTSHTCVARTDGVSAAPKIKKKKKKKKKRIVTESKMFEGTALKPCPLRRSIVGTSATTENGTRSRHISMLPKRK